MQLINPSNTTSEARKALKATFKQASPYPHLVIDNFLKPEVAAALSETFPSIDKLSKHYHGINENKSEGSNFENFPQIFTDLKSELMSPDFYQWIEDVTGVKDVFITDDTMGAGLHQGTTGSFLDVHVDFSIHQTKKVYRRINILIYFNDGWKDEWNGALELWNSDMTKCEKLVYPYLNRCVIFETSDTSYHGYATRTKQPEGVTRKSFYAYLYTNGHIKEDVVYHDTKFKSKPSDTLSKKLKTSLKETAKSLVKGTLNAVGLKFERDSDGK